MKGSKRNERKDAERESVVLKAAAVTPAGLILLLLALAVRGCGIGRKPAGQSSEAETVCESSSSTIAVNLSDIPSFRTTYPDISGTIYSFLSPSENSAESQSAPSSAVSAASAASSVPAGLPSAAAPAASQTSASPSTSSAVEAQTAPPTAAAQTAPPTTAAPTAPPTTAGAEPKTTASAAAPSSTAALPSATVHEHRFGPWTVTAAPSCTAAGAETRTCSVCRASETRPIPATGHDWRTETVVIREAGIEYVKTQDAWDERILLQEARTEEVTEMHWFCEGCGMDQTVYGREHGLLDADGRWTEEGLEWDAQHAKEHALRGESDRTYSAPVVIGVIEHPAEYAVIRHDEEYSPVIIPEETAEIRRCSRCGAEE